MLIQFQSSLSSSAIYRQRRRLHAVSSHTTLFYFTLALSSSPDPAVTTLASFLSRLRPSSGLLYTPVLSTYTQLEEDTLRPSKITASSSSVASPLASGYIYRSTRRTARPPAEFGWQNEHLEQYAALRVSTSSCRVYSLLQLLKHDPRWRYLQSTQRSRQRRASSRGQLSPLIVSGCLDAEERIKPSLWLETSHGSGRFFLSTLYALPAFYTTQNQKDLYSTKRGDHVRLGISKQTRMHQSVYWSCSVLGTSFQQLIRLFLSGFGTLYCSTRHLYSGRPYQYILLVLLRLPLLSTTTLSGCLFSFDPICNNVSKNILNTLDRFRTIRARACAIASRSACAHRTTVSSSRHISLWWLFHGSSGSSLPATTWSGQRHGRGTPVHVQCRAHSRLHQSFPLGAVVASRLLIKSAALRSESSPTRATPWA